ncbi:putative ribosomal protein YlxQ [Desulfosporosinus acididurans]|uniref:Putative ribosomal protein YlxQ n=1 Tax=Desulfosporosinus acididurans TaxID=476652 RepID=A0A0J1FMR9_9FIRM|nr:ribosomal L7Ae/L30e/S12e/Gadd45 family protein [Desulfosporosinus acididurans]KLU64770.1 putative ribosomal protein YlxQ [Desulfosporosinus acididurans]
MNSRIQALMGLARRAGKIASGEAQVEALLKKKKGYCLILAEDAPGAYKKFDQWAKDLKLPVVVTGTKHELGHSIGLSPRSAVLILDQGFAKAISLARS